MLRACCCPIEPSPLAEKSSSDSITIAREPTDRQRVAWSTLDGDRIGDLMNSGAIRFLDAHWIVAHSKKPDAKLARRQDLPDEAFIGLEDLKAAVTSRVDAYMWLPIAILSCPSTSPTSVSPTFASGLVSRLR